MSIKPVLVPDQDAKTLRALLESFDAAASGAAPKQLTESVAEGTKIAKQLIAEGRIAHFRPPFTVNGNYVDDARGNTVCEMGQSRDALKDIADALNAWVKQDVSEDYNMAMNYALNPALNHAMNMNMQQLAQSVAQLSPEDLSTLTQMGKAALGGGVVGAGAMKLGSMFLKAMRDTNDLAKNKAKADTSEIIALQKQISSINKMLQRVKTGEAKEKYQTMLKTAYEVLDELKARHGNQVAEGLPGSLSKSDYTPGKTVKNTSTNCTTCHGRKVMYKLDGKLFADNKKGATKVKCPTCKGTGDKQDLSEGIMDVVKRTFNDNVVGWPMGTSDEQFLQGWARAIKRETGRDIPVEKLAKLYQDYIDRDPSIMQTHGTTNEEAGVAEGRDDDDDIWTSAKSGGPKGLPQGRRGQTGREQSYDWSKKYDDYAPDDEGDDWYDDLDEAVMHRYQAVYSRNGKENSFSVEAPDRTQAIAKAKDMLRGENAQLVSVEEQPYTESIDSEEYNDEAGMAHSNLITIARAAEGLLDTIDDNENLPEWAQEKIAKVEGMLVAVWDYLESQEQQGIDPEIESESFYESAAWKRKEGKNKNGGLNAKGVASYRRENPGSKLQTAVTTKPSKLKPDSKAAKRRKSFCARMSGVKGPMKKPNGKPTRKALALRKWNCESIEQSVAMLESVGQNLKELKQRLDPKCWKGKHKEGTKIKGGVRVNNCVPNESIKESVDPVEQIKRLLG